MAVRIEAFDPGLHNTKDFRCGSDSQDNFLRRTAKRQQRDGYTRLYVATDATGLPPILRTSRQGSRHDHQTVHR